MEYVITRVSDIPKDESTYAKSPASCASILTKVTVPELVKKCRAVFEAALYSSLAVPEVLERGTAMASTYEDVVAKSASKFTAYSWRGMLLMQNHSPSTRWLARSEKSDRRRC